MELLPVDQTDRSLPSGNGPQSFANDRARCGRYQADHRAGRTRQTADESARPGRLQNQRNLEDWSAARLYLQSPIPPGPSWIGLSFRNVYSAATSDRTRNRIEYVRDATA